MEIHDVILLIILIPAVSGLLFCLIKLTAMSGVLGPAMVFLLGHNDKFSKKLDDAVNYALENCRIHQIDEYEIKFENGLNIWVHNKWYGYGYQAGKAGRVSWKTAKKLIQIERSRRGK